MVKPKIIQLEKASEFATAMAAHNEIKGTHERSLIKVNQISTIGSDAFVKMTRSYGFRDEDIKFITEIARNLSGSVRFEETGEIIVNF